jgi:hypothetical protein
LDLDSVLRGTVEAFDAKMLLGSLEEQLYLPTAFVECADGKRRQNGLAGREHQRIAALGILEADTSQVSAQDMPPTVKAVQGDAMVAYDTPERR